MCAEPIDTRSARALGEAVLGALSVGVLVLDDDFNIRHASRGAIRVLGRDLPTGLPLRSLVVAGEVWTDVASRSSSPVWERRVFPVPGSPPLTLRCALQRVDAGTWILILERYGDGDVEAIAGAAALANQLATKARELEIRNRELEHARAEIKTLDSLLPICSGCRRIRSSTRGWESLEEHVMHRTHSRFSHGLCDECGPKYFGEDWKG